MSSSSPREIIQISLGPSSNAVTAHLLNLQGLAATTSSDNSDGAYCDPVTTHYVQSHTNVWVPRVLMIDESSHSVPFSDFNTNVANTTEIGASTSLSSFLGSTTFTSIPWSGQVQIVGGCSADNETHKGDDPFGRTASVLAYSPYSRYHAQASSTTAMSSSGKHRSSLENTRHVVWDDDEEEEINEEAAEEYAYRRLQAKRDWTAKTAVSLGQELNELLIAKFPVKTDLSSSLSRSVRWTDIWMPPRAEESNLILPFSSKSQMVANWDVTYHDSCQTNTPLLQQWKEDVLLESLRHLLEPCDCGIQGAIITTESHGIYASLASYLLDELQEECKSAGRWVNHITKHVSEVDAAQEGYETEAVDEAGKSTNNNPNSHSWQEAQVARVRKQISSGLALYDFTEKAHVMLPLQLTVGPNGGDEFYATAQIAMALEACGLPFRFHGRNNSHCRFTPGGIPYQMGLQNAPFLGFGGADTSWGSTARRLTVQEYMSILQPSSRHSILELDVILQSTKKGGNQFFSNQMLFGAIVEGTSVERDHRMRQQGEVGYRSRPQDVLPGSWLEDVQTKESGAGGGLLSSLSYSSQVANGMNLDRSAHHHFALSASVRPMLLPPTKDSDGTTLSSYLTCLMQGMGIRYRPERSMATVLNQTLGQLTFGDNGGGGNYAAGVYWKYVLPQVDTPVVAVLGNTTRAFVTLNQIATDMKMTMRNSRFRGYYNRDNISGLLPDLDDCEEALEGCWSKSDLYYPPGLETREDDFD
jgi:hypothetical protein